MTDVLIRRRPYGSLLFEDCEPVLIDFFCRDMSSTDGELSYDDRAMTERAEPDVDGGCGPDAFDAIDATVIRRGMGLNRHPKAGWAWLVERAPADLVAALPSEDLGDVDDEDYPEVRRSGFPWSLVRDAHALDSCFIGISFYFDNAGNLATSSAQVFDERGEGIIVRGGQAKLSKGDRRPYLEAADAEKLLLDALKRLPRRAPQPSRPTRRH